MHLYAADNNGTEHHDCTAAQHRLRQGSKKNVPIGGNNPDKIIQSAPVMIVNRLTTLVIAISPTFWLNDVTGRQPNKDETLLASHRRLKEPEISFSVISVKAGDNHSCGIAIVSVADTRKITTTDKIAPMLNSGVNGSSLGSEMVPHPSNRLNPQRLKSEAVCSLYNKPK